MPRRRHCVTHQSKRHWTGFLRSALETMNLLLENGHYVDKDGKSAFVDSWVMLHLPNSLAQFSVLALIRTLVATVLDGESGGSPKRPFRCNACECLRITPLYKHIFWRFVSHLYSIAVFPRGTVTLRYCTGAKVVSNLLLSATLCPQLLLMLHFLPPQLHPSRLQ